MSDQLYVGNTSCKVKTFNPPQQITAILPSFNEEVSIGSIVLLTRLYVDKVIVVDDGSSDRTSEIARRAGAEVVVHETNIGKGGALKTGFLAAVNMGADVIVTIDSDAQHNPADIPKLISPIIKGEADLVNGSRYISGKDRNTPAYRRLGQTVLDKATNVNSGIKITDSQSGFRAFTASTVNIFRFNAHGMEIESEMLADAGRAGLRITEVEINVRYDVDGSTMNPIKHGINVLMSILNDMGFNRPLYYFTASGMTVGTIGIIIGVQFLKAFSMGQNLYFGPVFLVLLMILVGGFLAMTGILLHSAVAVSRNTK